MKITILTALAAATLASAPLAHAGEGNGDPFAHRMPGATTPVQTGVVLADAGSEAMPNPVGRPGGDLPQLAGDVLPMQGSEAPVQTADSLPAGAMEGTVAYAQARQIERSLQAQAEATRRAAHARAGVAVAGGG